MLLVCRVYLASFFALPGDCLAFLVCRKLFLHIIDRERVREGVGGERQEEGEGKVREKVRGEM